MNTPADPLDFDHNLQQRLEQMQLALNLIQDAVVWTDAEGRIERCNPAFAQLVQATSTPVGQPFVELLPLHQAGELLSEVAHPVARCPTSSAPMRCEFITANRVQPIEIVSAELSVNPPEASGKLFVIRVLPAATAVASDEMALQQLNQDLEARVEQRTQELIASLNEKEVLLKELHHRVKNNLQMIQSLLNLQARSLEDPQVLEVLTESQKRIRAMALVHEKLYQSNSLARIRFSDYVRSLTRDLLQSYVGNLSTIQVAIQVADVELPVDIAIPCGLIINELFSNAIKYAFVGNRSPERARQTDVITVQFRSEQTNPINSAESPIEHYVLTVSDNGIGIPEAIDIQTTRSLGLRLVHALTRQLRGTLNLEGHHGTQFTITFAKPL
jgi:two-component sensor histidine kinase